MSTQREKHTRVFIACLSCRKSKVKCLNNNEDDQPCARCIQRNLHCVYEPVNASGGGGMAQNAGASTSQAGYYYHEGQTQPYTGNDYQYGYAQGQQTQQQGHYDPNNQGYYYHNGAYYSSGYQGN
ncbi:unnamed protein product [Mycena citricolor]|uniref:Zn(2)-C6 fungal-type domain-containing protein n=1 Tax=Mycena citricolor TaxID=2018698 RepID=A0AAD2K3I0_9AGAR|nr:unnamed protein product [Mycena citricolor]